MCRTIIRPVHYLLFSLLGVLVLPAVSQAAKHYDVSYVWSKNATSVRAYRERVVRVLGPGVSKGIKLVANGELFGVVYVRRGDSSGATRVARVHSELLRAQGLDGAAPVISQDWMLVDDEHREPVSFASVTPASVPRASMTTTERAREIRDVEAAVEAYIKKLRREGKLESDERTGWSVYDFTTGEKLVTINEDIQFQAASLVKPFIAAAFFKKVESGGLIYGNRSRRHMERMIQRSSNPSTNWVMRQVGGPQAVERLLKKHYPGIFEDTRLVEYIPANGRTYSNKASAHDYSRFLYALWNGKIAGAKEIKRLMALPGGDRIFMGAKDVPKGTEVYNKTGSTARLCGDIGILNVEGPDGKRYPYTLIGIIEKQERASNYSDWIRARSDVIRNVSSIVYKGIAQHHNI